MKNEYNSPAILGTIRGTSYEESVHTFGGLLNIRIGTIRPAISAQLGHDEQLVRAGRVGQGEQHRSNMINWS